MLIDGVMRWIYHMGTGGDDRLGGGLIELAFWMGTVRQFNKVCVEVPSRGIVPVLCRSF